MGSPDFAVPTVARLAATHDLCAVYSQPAKKSGRGMAERPVPVAAWALDHDVPLFTPDNLKAASIHHQLAEHQADIFVVVAYGLILPKSVLALPTHGCLNVHASILPRWRGAGRSRCPAMICALTSGSLISPVRSLPLCRRSPPGHVGRFRSPGTVRGGIWLPVCWTRRFCLMMSPGG